MYLLHSATMVIGKLLSKFTGKSFLYFYFMLTTCEGGNIAYHFILQLLESHASNTVIFDLAGTLIAFVVIPVMVAKIGGTYRVQSNLLKLYFQIHLLLQ